MILAMLLLASTGVQSTADKTRGPVPIGLEAWRAYEDYPAKSLRQGEMGIVEFQLDIDARGRVQACRIIGSSGYWTLDDAVCAVSRKRMRFKAASDNTGLPIASTFTSRFTWAIPGGKMPAAFSRSGGSAEPLELVVTVVRLPKDYQRPSLLHLRFAAGGVSECVIEGGSGSRGLDDVACTQARQQVQRPTAVPGMAEPDARTATVVFEAAPTAQ